MPSAFVRPRLTAGRRRLLDRQLDHLLELEPETRSRELAELDRRAPRLAYWLHKLIAADNDDELRFETLFQRIGQAAERDAQPADVELPTGTRLGPWRIIEPIGSGGMGRVYRAERADDAFQMVVAIKLIRLQRIAFEARLRLERELLARLDHRNVARLIDGGTTPQGQAYLVMEWIEGRDLDRYVDEENPTLDERLDLFEQMAEGVAHAHQQRVVHGDLKPSNVRVADDARVCLIDFGVARLVAEGEGLMDQSVNALTPAFSAPEQLAGQAATTLSDVWAMGVVLEWLLTGKVAESGNEGRRAELPGRLVRKSDLQAIIERACHESASARYASVERMLDDLRRYRGGFPVWARPRSRRLMLQRFIGRNRFAVSAGALALVALFAALAGAVWQAHEATLERDRAAAQTALALSAREESSRLAEELQAVVDFQENRLSEIDPAAMGLELRQGLIAQRRRALEREARPEQQIEQAVERFQAQLAGINLTDLSRQALDEKIIVEALANIDRQFHDQPQLRARLLQAVANTARGLGLLERALPAQREALSIRRAWLGDDHPMTIDSITRAGSLHASLGDHDKALAYHQEALALSREVHGEHHPGTLTVINNLATVINANGDHERAGHYFRKVLDGRRALLGDDHPDSIIAASNLASGLAAQERLDEARHYYREVLERRRASLGENHPDTLRAVANLGWLLARMELYEDAYPYYQSALKGRRQILGNNHPQTLRSINNMASLLGRMDRPDEAAVFYREVLQRSRTLLGDRHPNTLIYINNTSALYRSTGDLEAAEKLAAEAVTSGRAVLRPGHWHLGVFLASHGLVLSKQGRFAEAESALLEAYGLYEQALGAENPRTASLVPELVSLYHRWHAKSQDADHQASIAAWQERIVDEAP